MTPDYDLFNRYLEGTLSEEEATRFDADLQRDDALRSVFASYLTMHGELLVEADSLLSDDEPTPAVSLKAPLIGLAAALVLGAGIAVGHLSKPPPPIVESVATLVDARSSRWGSSSLPTVPGSRLQVGTLELVEGLATVEFDEGASITLEAPASIEIISGSRCRLLDGAAVAWVPDGAEGFQIETTDALVTDYGTRFGITADSQSGQSEVLVLEGEVGVNHHRDGGPEQRIKTGEIVRYDAEQLLLTRDEGGSETERGGGGAVAEGWIEIKPSRDAFIRNLNPAQSGRSPLVMVKHSTGFPGNQRKGYFGFNTNRLPKDVSEAVFQLSIQPSGMGYASVVPDSTFRVFGMVGSDWQEGVLQWEGAPANVADSGFALDETQVVELGDFEIPQGVASGTARVSGPALVDFLTSHRGEPVTLIVVRETDETDRHGLVHAFASREHPSAAGPVLRVR